MNTTWNDLAGSPTPWWGLPKLAAMRRDDFGTIGAWQAHGDRARLRILIDRPPPPGRGAYEMFKPRWRGPLMRF